jgi:hypothetical protein
MSNVFGTILGLVFSMIQMNFTAVYGMIQTLSGCILSVGTGNM